MMWISLYFCSFLCLCRFVFFVTLVFSFSVYVCLSGCLSVFVCLCLSVCVPVSLPVCLSACLNICPSRPSHTNIQRTIFQLLFSPSNYLSGCLSVSVYLCLSVCWSLSRTYNAHLCYYSPIQYADPYMPRDHF